MFHPGALNDTTYVFDFWATCRGCNYQGDRLWNQVNTVSESVLHLSQNKLIFARF